MPPLIHQSSGGFIVSCRLEVTFTCYVCGVEGSECQDVIHGSVPYMTMPDGWGYLVHDGHSMALCPEHNNVIINTVTRSETTVGGE